jgi:hypothetical protein
MVGSHIAFIAKRATMLAIAELINDPGKSKPAKLSVTASHFHAAFVEVKEKEGFSSC